MGELHLEIIVDRLLREFNVQANVGRPQVAYGAIADSARAEGRFVRQTGGRGQFGHVVLEVEPGPRIGPRSNKIVGRRSELHTAVEHGIRGIRHWNTSWISVVDVAVALVDGSYHEVDSSEISFKMLARLVSREAVEAAKPVLLEPIAKVEIVTLSGKWATCRYGSAARGGDFPGERGHEPDDSRGSHCRDVWVYHFAAVAFTGKGQPHNAFSQVSRSPHKSEEIMRQCPSLS